MTDLAPYVELMARRYMRAYARWLCNGYAGRGKLDGVYMGTTERRDGPGPAQWRNYSSCGDLSQELVFQMGVRKPFVNRAAYEGWRSGRMLLDFYARDLSRAAHRSPAVEPARYFIPAAGDIGFIWSDAGDDAHTCTFGDHLEPAKIETFNYGAGGMSPTEFPGAKQSDVPLQYRFREPTPVGSRLVLHPIDTIPAPGVTPEPGVWIGHRKLRYVLTVPMVLALVESPDLLPTMTTETIEALEARVK